MSTSTQSLGEWLKWLETLHPREIELGLERVRTVADRLALAETLRDNGTRVVTVAGTNGKGSCVATLESLLGEDGWTVGAYTSPHFIAFNERIRIGGNDASSDAIVAAFQAVEAARQSVSLTYFEYTTLAALWLFARQSLDVILLEVGLGGRLDAVNILDPNIAMITQIDLDHQAWLGEDREQIGREKAGILRPGGRAICSDRSPPDTVTEEVESLGAQCVWAGQEFGWETDTKHWRWWGQGPGGESLEYKGLPLPRLPIASVAAAIQAAVWLGVAVNEALLGRLLMRLALPGRFQTLDLGGRQLLLDVAHNPAAAGHLAQRLAQQPVAGRTLAVAAVMGDKDYAAMFAALGEQVDYWYTATLPDMPRAAGPGQLLDTLHQLGLTGESCDTVANALSRIAAVVEPADRILVMGSFYTVAAALEWVEEQSSPEDGIL